VIPKPTEVRVVKTLQEAETSLTATTDSQRVGNIKTNVVVIPDDKIVFS
jgi:hypothetical protein